MANNVNTKKESPAMNDAGSNAPLPLIKEGQTDKNFLSAEFANMVLKRENVLWNVKGENGIKITKSDSNMIIGFDTKEGDKPSGDNNKGGNITGSINHESGSITNYFCNARYT